VLAAGAAQAGASYALRYGFESGQRWQAVQTLEGETTVGGVSERHTGVARFRYEVHPADPNGEFRLEARMLSQEMATGPSPIDFSAIRFQARTDARGVTRGKRFELEDVTPPKLPGVPDDPAAFSQLLRSLASAWIDSVYWLPVLPEEPLAVGESFVVDDRGDVGGTDPGVRMEMRTTTTYRLRGVIGDLAEFAIEVRSTVDAQTAGSGLTSSLHAEGEAIFDLDRGMWRRQEIRSQHDARVSGAESGADRVTARSTTTTTMEPLAPDA
jgi:hypothetical protein